MHEAWVHNMSPFLWEITEGFGFRWYGLSYLAGFVCVYLLTLKMSELKIIALSPESIPDLITYGAIGTLVGGRLGYVLFYAPDLLTSFHASFPYWGLLEVHKGGMASHGGMVGIVVGCFLFARRYKYLASHVLDVVSLSGPLGVLFGRIANFINGELYGRECASDFKFAVKFPTEIFTWGAQDASKLKALGPAVEALGTFTVNGSEKISATASLWSDWVTNFGFEAQKNIEIFKDALVRATQSAGHTSELAQVREAVVAALGPALTPRYPSQLYEALLEGLFIFVILILVWRKPRKPGVITVVFGSCYVFGRILSEQFRLPDYNIGLQALGLTRGQWLSVGMFVLIFIYGVLVLRRRSERMGGWAVKNKNLPGL